MEFKEFSINEYFRPNYGMGPKPDAGKLKMKRVLLGAFLVLLGILAIITLASIQVIVGLVLMAILIGAGLIIMLPTIFSKTKSKNAADAWQAEYDHRKSTWDHEYDEYYQRTVAQMNLRASAMLKIGISEEQLCDVQPFFIYGAILNGAQDWYRTDSMGVIRADHNEITWLFFSKDQVYLYDIKFRLTSPKRSETTQEFFYSDIVSVTIGTESTAVDSKNCVDGYTTGSIDVEKFKLIVPGDKMSFAFTSNDGVSGSIQAMKNKIRDKKIS